MMMTTEDYKARSARSKKLMLWFAMGSMVMVFAALTSSYVVSSSRADFRAFEMPAPFFVSTALMLLSSLTFHFVRTMVRQGKREAATALLLTTLVLGCAFIYFQFEGFDVLFDRRIFPAGSQATITASFLWVLVLTHLAHLAGGMISLLVIIYNHFKQKYGPAQTLGIELGALFWHFLDFLWLYLFLFLYFFK